jgi:GLPGLI family protein
MKSLLFFSLVLFLSDTAAQKRFSEGTIQYKVTTVLNQDTVANDIRYTEMIKGGHYRADLISSVAQTTTLFDAREESGAIIRTFGTNKILTPITRENWNEINSKFINAFYQVTEQQKEIMGHVCTLAKASLKDGSQLEVYFASDIIADNADLSIRFGQLPGLALEYSSKTGTDRVAYTVVSISYDPVPIQLFDVPTTGYRLLGYEDSKNIK